MKPVLLDPATVRPQMDEPRFCATCKKKSARWLVLTDSAWISMCSLCWLYATPWGEQNAEGLAELVVGTEKSLGRQFVCVDGKLSDFADGDRILSAISLTSRIFKAAERR